ncbi:MAG TPA: hypothetical protein VKV28_04485 [Candidatus Binataceae bacterium]|nr:hypothetical protein [Candidatus Binataceae bacterium]
MNQVRGKTSLVFLALVMSCVTLVASGDVGAAPTHADHARASQFNLDAVFAQAGGGSIAPCRMIYDPYPTFAQMAVDPKNNLVVIADNSSASLLVYDRNKTAANQAGVTPYLARLKGEATHVDSPIGVALDPETRRIFFSDNDIAETLGSFPYGANGDYPASTLAIPVGGSGLGLSLRLRQKALAEEDLGIIMIFRLDATGGEPPLREIRGPHTGIADPRGLYWDDVNHEIVIANDGNWNPGYWNADYTGGGHFFPPSIAVFDDGVKGDARPKRVIQGPQTQLNWPFQVAVDPVHNEIAVANLGADSVLIFKRTATGDMAPIRVLRGPHTGIETPTGVAFDLMHDELWVANYGHQAMAFARTANGDASPTRIIRSAPAGSPVVGVSLPFNLTYDPGRDELLVKN